MKNEVGKWYRYDDLGDKGGLYAARANGSLSFGFYMGKDPEGFAWWGPTAFSQDTNCLSKGEWGYHERDLVFVKVGDGTEITESKAFSVIYESLI